MADAHRGLGPRAWRACLRLLALAALAACSATRPGPAPAPAPASHATKPPAPAGTAPAAPGPAAASVGTAATDPSFDWRNLVVIPFGSNLRDLHASLHEVLFFRDDAGADGKPEPGDCYSSDEPSPRFVGRATDHYYQCFRNDRLTRVQAVVTLPNDEAPILFARLCDAWLKDGPPSSPGAPVCEGRDGGAAFSARLDGAADDATTELSIVVHAAEAPD
ncbi:MAG: hypothetical protein ACLQJ0_03075 [Steroidobacteraceae bacterium]|jgi:hypothetical protein